jgi:magnesium transporter
MTSPSASAPPGQGQSRRTLTTIKGSVREPDSSTLRSRLKVCREEGFWLDIQAPEQADFALLVEVFGLHPLTLEDIRQRGQRPKLEEYAQYSFIVLFVPDRREETIRFQEHHLLVADDYLVTIHDEPAPELGTLRARIEKNPELTLGKPGFLAYLVVGGLVDAAFPVLEQVENAIDEVEQDILERAAPALLRKTYSIRRDVITFRMFLAAERDLFQRLITHSLGGREQELSLYWRDVYDHLLRQYETVDSLRELVSAVHDVYLSTVSNRLNSTMKALTVVASLFLPLTFLSGFFGMNFSFLTGVLETSAIAFIIAVILMAVSVIIQFWFFRRRGWV